MKKIFGVCPQAQKKEIEKYCFKECGKILVGALGDDLIDLLPCKEKKCPYEETTLEYGTTENRGDGKLMVVIRKLKDLKK